MYRNRQKPPKHRTIKDLDFLNQENIPKYYFWLLRLK